MTTLPGTIQERIALPGAVMSGGAPTPAELLAILRRRWILIVTLFVLFGGAAGGGFYVWWRYFPMYSATGRVELISNRPAQELSVQGPRMPDREQDRFMLTQSFIVKSPDVLNKALQTERIQKTTWYRSIPSYKSPLLALTEELTSVPLRGTNFLSISISTRDPKDPDRIVSAVMDTYVASVLDRATDPYRADRSKAQEELNSLDARLASKRSELKLAADRLAGGVFNPAVNAFSQKGAYYAQESANLQIQLAQLQQIRQAYAQETAITAEDQAAVDADPQVAVLRNRLFQLQQQRDDLGKRLGERHPNMRQLSDAIDSTNRSLTAASMAALDARRRAIIEAAETAVATTSEALLSALEGLASAEAGQKENDRALLAFQDLKREIETLEERRDEIDKYIEDLNRLVANQSAMTIRIAQQPFAPLARSAPSLLMLPVFLLLAAILSVGLAVGLDVLDTSVRTSQDVMRHVQLPLLGVVPDVDDEEVHIERVELAMLTAPQSLMAEAFRQIRASLQFSAPAARQRSIVVTSPGPDDGKTTVACNLAVAVAQAGRRVLLVDANLRRPRLDDLWPGIQERGLTNLLVGDGTLDELASRTSIPNLQILGAGAPTPSPAELLGSDIFRAFLDTATQRYDQVILDTSPVLIASDPCVLGTMVDGVILTLRARTNSRGAARRAAALLAGVHAHIFGAVLNAAQAARGGYFREQLRTYYDYNPPRLDRGSSRGLPR